MGVVDAVHSEVEDGVDRTSEEVMGTMAKTFLHLVENGKAEKRTLFRHIIETKALVGIAGPKTKLNIRILHLPVTEINMTVNHFLAFHRTAN